MNKRELQAEMKRNGYTYKTLAVALNISENAFWRKMNGVNDFTLSEIREMLTLLNLSEDKAIGIFLQGC